MNRRSFIAISSSLAATIVFPEWLMGCSKATIAGFVTTIGTAITNVVKILAPALATKLQAAWQLAVTDINNWQSGSPASEAAQALTDFEAVVADLSIPELYKDVIDAAIIGIESILALFPNSSKPSVTASVAAAKARTTVIPIASPSSKDISEAENKWKIMMRSALAKHPDLKGVKV